MTATTDAGPVSDLSGSSITILSGGTSVQRVAVAAHEQQLLEMRLAMDRLRSELVAMRGSLTQDARDEPPPPHY